MQYGKIQIWSIQKALTNRNQKDSSTKILSLTLRFCRFPLWSNVFISKFVAALKATEFKPFTLVILLYFLHPTIKWFPFHLSLLFSSAFFLCQARLWGFFWPFSFLFFSESLAEPSMKVTSLIASAARGTCSISALPWWTRGSRLASSQKLAFTERGLKMVRRHTCTHKSITNPLCRAHHTHKCSPTSTSKGYQPSKHAEA